MYLHKSRFVTVPLIPHVESDTKDIRVRSWENTDGWTVEVTCTIHREDRIDAPIRVATIKMIGTAYSEIWIVLPNVVFFFAKSVMKINVAAPD